MYKVILPAFAAMLLFSAGRAAGAEFDLTCVWERGAKFEIKISDNGVIKNGHKASNQVSISESLISWHETPISGVDYEYNVDRHTGILIATAFSRLYNHKVEDRGLCMTAGGAPGDGF